MSLILTIIKIGIAATNSYQHFSTHPTYKTIVAKAQVIGHRDVLSIKGSSSMGPIIWALVEMIPLKTSITVFSNEKKDRPKDGLQKSLIKSVHQALPQP